MLTYLLSSILSQRPDNVNRVRVRGRRNLETPERATESDGRARFESSRLRGEVVL